MGRQSRRTDLEKTKGRREAGAFVPMPCTILDHENFVALSARASRLLFDLFSQLRMGRGGPRNNGDLCATWSMMRKRGWRSKGTLHRAVEELVKSGFIEVTRQGGRNKPTLYAITWWSINECGGKLDVSATKVPSNKWRENKSATPSVGQVAPPCGSKNEPWGAW